MRRLCALALVAFAFAMLRAASAYSGGSWFDADSQGFDFWQNYWCDLLAPIAHDGGDNRLARAWSRLGFLSFGVALAGYFSCEAQRLARGRVWLGAAAACSVGVLAAVTLTSARDQPVAHGAAVLGSALSGLVGLALVMRWAPLSRFARALGWITLATALGALLTYALQGAEIVAAPWLPGAQKVTSAFLIAFIVTRLLTKDQ